jgi:ferredoxin
MDTCSHKSRWLHPSRLRLLVQWGFLAWCLALGLQFGLFVKHFATFGQTPAYSRPPGVEGFLPIGALVSLKNMLINGSIDPVHPAALVLLLTFLTLALLAKNAFCSWLCPVGTLSDGLWRLGRRLIGRSLTVWPWLDRVLRGGKYLLLAFFLKLVAIDMPAAALQGFLTSPYWAVADVRMLHFFTAPSPLTLGVLGVLVVLTLLYRNAWCRYLCPYGALLGLLSLLSPLKVRRDPATCSGCRRCTNGCPGRIAVHEKTTVRHVECTACLTCVANCPEPGTLELRLVGWRRPLPGWGFALAVLLLFTAGVGSGMLTGHWYSVLTEQDYRQLIPLADRMGF